MKNAFATLMLLVLISSCIGGPQRRQADTVEDLMQSTVQIHVDIAATALLEADGGIQEVPIEQSWVGSGVVYAKTSGLLAPVKSKILSAHHVLDVPPAGAIVAGPFGPVRIDAVLMTIRTRAGLGCNLTPVALGDYETGDVATAIADCDAGRVAEIADAMPAPGSKVTVTGHPLGVPLAIVTEGYVSGWMDGFYLISAPAFGGNSGGPVWYNGKVIGLLVRGAPRYPLISLVTPLAAVLERISQTP